MPGESEVCKHFPKSILSGRKSVYPAECCALISRMTHQSSPSNCASPFRKSVKTGWPRNTTLFPESFCATFTITDIFNNQELLNQNQSIIAFNSGFHPVPFVLYMFGFNSFRLAPALMNCGECSKIILE